MVLFPSSGATLTVAIYRQRLLGEDEHDDGTMCIMLNPSWRPIDQTRRASGSADAGLTHGPPPCGGHKPTKRELLEPDQPGLRYGTWAAAQKPRRRGHRRPFEAPRPNAP